MYQTRIKESPMKLIGPPMQGITMNQTSQSNCNLCGTLGSSVKCDRCDCKTFCMSCDDMYHRHPKRRFHLRKAINPVNPMSQRCDNVSTSVLRPLQATLSPSPSPSLSSLSSSNNHSEMKSTAIKSTQFQATATPHHPSKMPIPPPRRKKKLLEDQNRPFLPQFGQTRLIQYQPGSNSQSVDQINQSGRYFNEQQQQQQQMRLNYNYLRPFEEEYQRESLNNGAGSSNLSSANSSSLSSEQWSSEVGSSGNVPPALPIKKKWSQSLPRKNLSLMDLTSPYMNPNPNAYYAGAGSPMHMMPGQMMNPSLPPNYPMSYSPSPYHPHHPGPYNMTSVSLAQSMEDLGLDDGEDQVSDADFPDHGTLTRNKSHLSSMMSRRNGSMKRSQSSFLVNNQWQQKQQQMVQPYWMNPVYPMYPGYPMMPGTHHPPLPPSSPYNNARASPSPSLRSLNMNRKTRSVSSREQSVRSSVAREASPAMVRKSSSSSHHQHHSSQSRNKSFDQRSTSIPRSLTSSRYSMRASESDEEDDGNQMRRKHIDNTDDDEGDYACQSDEEEDNEDEDEDEDDRYSQASSLEPNKWWHCYACTYVNKPNSDICEMCGKSHPSRLKKMRNKTKVTKEPVKESKPNQSNRNGPEVVITTDLIREQMEIEKELRRRLENEKRIERENRRLEKKEEKKRNQYLSTPSIDEIYDVGDNNISNPLIPSTSNSSVIPAATTIRTESIQRVDSIKAKNDSKVSFKTNKNSNSISSMNNDHYEGDHYLNKDNVSQVKASGNTVDELDWPDSVISSGDKHRKKEGERSFSSPTNFQDIEATFAKLEQEIDSIRNSNKKETGNKDISLDENKTNEPKKTDDNTKSKSDPVSLQDVNEKPKVQPSTASNIGANINQETEKVIKSNNNESSEIKKETTAAQNNESKTTVDEKASDTTIPTNNSPQMVNQPVNQSTQLVPSSQIPMSLPTIYQQSGQQMYPQFTNQYPMMGQQLTPINSGTAFPNYDVNRLRSNSYVGLNSPPADIINNPLAIYASNYQPPGPSMYNYPMNNLPQSSPHMILDSNSFSFRSDQNALHNMGQLGGFSSKYMSNENLSIDNRSNQGLPSMGTQGVATVSSAQSQLQSGFQMFKLLRDAEKKGFTADDIEIALTFNSTSPLDWLDENWNNMVETVLTLSNNQLVQNEKKRLGKKYKLTAIDLVTTKDAKSALRSTKGNIWQAIDKCVQKKEDDKTVDKKDIKSFSLDIEESGSGKSNMDAVPINLLSSNEASQNLKAKSPTLNEKYQKQDEISISRSSSSSGEYFSEVSEESDTDGRLLNVEVRNSDALDETEEIETQETEAKDEQELEAEVNEVEEHEEYEEEEDEDEDEVDEDVDNEELVRLRSDSFEGDEEHDNDKNVDEDETEMEDYENLRRSLEQRLTQLGLNSIDEYIDDSDEDKEDDQEDENNDKDNEIGQEFEILNKDDFSSNDSDKWSEQSSEQSSDQDKDNEVIDQLAPPRQLETKERSISPLTIDLEETLKSSVECLETLYRTSLQTASNTSNQSIDENQMTTINEPGQSQETKTSNKPKEKLKKGLNKKLATKELTNQNKEKDKQLQELNPSATSTSLSKNSSDNGKGQQTLIPAIPITNLPVIDKESLNPHFGYARSAYECELCAGSFHIRDMVSLISCTHKACINCLRQYFAVQIREAQVFIITCPFCSEPSISHDDEDSVCDYLSLLDQLVKSLVTADLHELWQRKVRDKVLSKDPSFSWCTNCSSGFIASNPAAKTITCPDCQIVTCASCHKVWEEQHNGITCEQFTEWKRLNDPEYSENQLDLHLKQFGIDCPKCHFHYELSKGGCMHFHCIQCSHDFCGGCRQPFRLGSKCSVSNWCDKLGLHAHHPRNCLFYLRDKEVDELRKLLDMNNVEYKYNEDKQSTNESRVCMIMEQKEYPEGLKDMPCGSNLETAGVCKQHYIEYLGGLIFEHGIDPIEIFTEDELIHVLRRSNVTLPTKKYGQDYRNILCEAIKKECPLIKDPIK